MSGPVPYWSDDRVELHLGDCLDVMRQMPDACVDSVVTDPPGAIGFMGRSWDLDRGGRDRWIAWLAERMEQACRVLKPGGHALVWSIPRTSGWTQMALEDAGFEIRDCIVHIFGSGYPKSLDVSKAIDKSVGATREVIRERTYELRNDGGYSGGLNTTKPRSESAEITAPATDEAVRWHGWGTALKPGQEIWWLAQKTHAQAGILDAIGSHLDRLESECRQLARSAAQSSAPTQAGSPAARTASAPAPAATRPEGVRESRTPTGAAAGSSALTDTSPSESTAGTFLSIVTSWRRCWAELCELTSTSTTGTTSSTTTDLKTLSSCLSRITAESMPASPSPGCGSPSLVTAADSLFAAAVLNSRATLALSVTAPASGSTPTGCQDEDAQDGSALTHSSGQEMWWLARKPITGTVAATVLEHGTGALNIAACKVGAEQRVNNAGGSSSLQRVSRVESGYRPTVTTSEGEASEVAGRWPANIVLTHSRRDWYALRHDIPEAVSSAIIAFYGPAEGVREVREELLRDALRDRETPILLSGLRGRRPARSPGEAMGAGAVPAVRRDIRDLPGVDTQRAPEILHGKMPAEGPGAERQSEPDREAARGCVASQDGHECGDQGTVLPVEGGAVPVQGLLVRDGGPAASRDAADRSTDDRRSLHPGAQGSGRADDRAPAGSGRCRASHQRREAGQPPGESNRDGTGASFTGAPRDREAVRDADGGSGIAPGGEHVLAVPADLIPVGWLSYFTHLVNAGCEVIGTRVIRGDSRSGQERGQRPGGFFDVGADGGSERPNGTLHGDQAADVFACAPDCPVAELDRQSGVSSGQRRMTRRSPDAQIDRSGYGTFSGQENVEIGYNDAGGASRFFHAFRYQAKAPSSERPRGEDGYAHVSVKSLGLIRHFVRLITPPGGTVLDCFAGSGPTAEACLIEGFDCVLVELEQPSAELIRTRLRKDIQPVMFGAAS